MADTRNLADGGGVTVERTDYLQIEAIHCADTEEVTAALLSDGISKSENEETSQNFQLFFTHSRDIMLFVDPSDGKIIEANPAAEVAYGYCREDLLEKYIIDLRAEQQVAVVQDQLNIAVRDGITFETVHRRKDGSIFPVEVTSRGGQAGDKSMLFSVVRDITERKDSEQALLRLKGSLEDRVIERTEALRAAHRLNAEILESISDGFFALDEKWRFIYANREAERLFGKLRHELLGNSILDIFDGRELDESQSAYAEAIREKRHFYGELRGIFHDCWYEYSIHPGASGLAVFFRDVTEKRTARERIREQAQLLDLAHDYIIVRDLDGKIIYWNQGARIGYGWSLSEALEQVTHDLLRTEFPEPVECIAASLTARGYWEGELVHTRKDGEKIFVISYQTLNRDAADNPLSILEINHDITARRASEESLRRSELRFQKCIDEVSDCFTFFRALRDESDKITDFIFEFVNEAECQAYGKKREELIGERMLTMWPGVAGKTFEDYCHICNTGEPLADEFYYDDKINLHLTGIYERQVIKVEDGVAICSRNITEKKYYEKQLACWNSELEAGVFERTRELQNLNSKLKEEVMERQAAQEALNQKTKEIRLIAYSDTLTGLPNRAHLNEQLTAELEKARRGETSGAIMFIDLDDLNTVNNTFGHTYGDALISMAGNRIVTEAGDGAFVARIGGDEFMVILPEADRNLITRTANWIIHALGQEHEAFGAHFQISASAGIALYPADGDTADEIFKNADNAKYAAKKAGKNCWRFYDAAMQNETYEKLVLTNSLRYAINRGELLVHYQPQVSVTDRAIVGFEALLRWNSPDYGSIPPARFVPLAEQSGFIHSIGRWVLLQACRFARRLAEQGRGDIRIAVNVSPHQLAAEDFVDSVSVILSETGVVADQLELEITETALLASLEDSTRKLSELRALGVRLSLDDFGTGYSSLTYLQRLPAQTLKIDKSFIDMILTDVGQKAIIGSIVDMAHIMEMTVVAEGVETEQQLEYLQRCNCDLFQGYIVSRPVAEEDALKLLPGSGGLR